MPDDIKAPLASGGLKTTGIDQKKLRPLLGKVAKMERNNMDDIKTTKIDQKKLRKLIDSVKNKIKQHDVVIDAFKKYNVDLDELDNIPMCFANLNVSARTDHGIIYFNISLLDDGDFEKDDHYMVHEVLHWLQHTTGDKPTQGADDGDYLENPAEVEGFQNQVDYLADTRSEEDAEKYVNKVLDHHGEKGKDREERKDVLMSRAERYSEFLRFC